ncbi:MAG: hypothetical protein ACNYPH_07910 [Gammaproteobacteria bacterium WSBS_2016_MAG_OTU1]
MHKSTAFVPTGVLLGASHKHNGFSLLLKSAAMPTACAAISVLPPPVGTRMQIYGIDSGKNGGE